MILKNPNAHETLDKTMVTKLKDDISALDYESLTHDDSADGRSDLKQAMVDLNDPLMPNRAHALIIIKQLIMARDKETIESRGHLINLLKTTLADPESYIYLSAINTLSSLAILETSDVLPVLLNAYSDENRSVQERMNTGQVLVNLSKNLNDFSSLYAKQMLECFYENLRHDDPMIRCSTLSCLGQLCSVLKFGLQPYINQMMYCLECLLQTEESMDVKRAGLMFLSLLLSGISADCIMAIEAQLLKIYRLVQRYYDTCLDDVMQLHAQISLEHLDRMAKELLLPNDRQEMLKTPKKLIQLL